MPLPRIAVLGALLALAIPASASADRLVDPGSPVFKSVDRETINTFGSDLIAFNGYVYFAANDNVNGNELWRTNGTTTELVANLNPGASGASGNPHSFYIAGSRLYFNANPGDSTSGVFYIDAAAPTTVETAKALRAPNGGGATGVETANATLVGVVNGKAILSRLQGENSNANYAVYALGDVGDTFTKISSGLDSIGATNVFSPTAVVGGYMYYARSNVNTSPGQGAELWRTDGSSTELVKDIYPNPPGSFPGSNPGAFVATSDRVYFLADDGVHGRELWVSNPADKNDTHMLYEHHAGLTGTYYDDPGAVANGNILYYTPNDPGTGGEVWRTDGTEAGTRVVQDITPGDGAFSGPDPFTFRAGVGMLRGSDIFYSDGTDAGTVKVGEADGDGYGPNTPVVRGEQAYFVGGYSPFGQAVWRTDGTPGGTNAITAGGFDGSANGCTCAQSLAVLDDKVIFFGRAPGTPDAGDLKLFYLDTTPADETRQATTPTTVTGTPAVGQTLTANKGAWTREANNKYEYAWLRNGVPIQTPLGIFQTTYTVRPEDAGAQIQARITAKGIGAPNAVASDSAPVTVTGPVASPGPGGSPTPAPSATPALTVRKKAKLRGKAKVGKKLKLRLPKLAQSGVKLSFKWYANGKRIKKQKKSSLKLSKKLKGKRISAKITLRKAGYKTLTVKVGPTRKVKGK